MAETDIARALRQSLEQATPRTKGVFGGANAMTAAEVEAFLSHAPVGLVSTVSQSGAPHMTGVGMILLDGRLYFGSDRRSALYRNLIRNPGVAVGLVEPPWKRHVLIQGTVRLLLEDSDEIRQVREAERTQHGWESGIVAGLDIAKVFTWKS